MSAAKPLQLVEPPRSTIDRVDVARRIRELSESYSGFSRPARERLDAFAREIEEGR